MYCMVREWTLFGKNRIVAVTCDLVRIRNVVSVVSCRCCCSSCLVCVGNAADDEEIDALDHISYLSLQWYLFSPMKKRYS